MLFSLMMGILLEWSGWELIFKVFSRNEKTRWYGRQLESVVIVPKLEYLAYHIHISLQCQYLSHTSSVAIFRQTRSCSATNLIWNPVSMLYGFSFCDYGTLNRLPPKHQWADCRLPKRQTRGIWQLTAGTWRGSGCQRLSRFAFCCLTARV